jgi:hypothetical protein
MGYIPWVVPAALWFCVVAPALLGVMSFEVGTYPGGVLKRPPDADDAFTDVLEENTGAVGIRAFIG